jgi:hypothetical protein
MRDNFMIRKGLAAAAEPAALAVFRIGATRALFAGQLQEQAASP